MTTMRDRILLVRLGGLGDVLAVLPSMALLRKSYPDRVLVFFGRTPYGCLLREAGVVDEALSSESREASSLFGESAAGISYPALKNDDIMMIVGWMQKALGPSIEANFRRLGSPSVRFFVHDPGFRGTISRYFFRETAESCLEQGKHVPKFDECVRFSLGGKGRAAAMELGGKFARIDSPFVIVHPGSGGAVKRWRLENFLEIANRWAGKGIPGFIVTGEAEEADEVTGVLEKTILPDQWTWLHCPPIIALAGLLERAAFYLGNDSGVSHLAAACGADGLALFRKEPAKVWMPYGRIRIIKTAELNALTIDKVWAEVRQDVLGKRLKSPRPDLCF